MRNKIFAIICVTALISTIFVSCTSSKDKQITSTTADSYEEHDNQFILEDKDVTDKDGQVVTDAQGNPVKEQVLVKVTSPDSEGTNENSGGGVIELEILSTQPTKVTETTTIPIVENPTQAELTTLPADKNIVPLTTDTGKHIDFSSADQQIIKQMLEVPFLYESSYENKDGVPINIASHVAIWQLQRDGISSNTYPEGTVVLNLFKYFGQTVVNYSNRCNNESSNHNIVYVSDKDSSGEETNKMFVISKLEDKTHTIKIDHIEDLGNNNYYKVVAKVEGAKGVKTVNAIVQRNKLDHSLGFSIKALNWK